jgi:hypothetical protein
VNLFIAMSSNLVEVQLEEMIMVTKRFKYSLTILMMLILVMIPVGALATDSYHVVVNGQEISFDKPVLFESWRALVPMNTVFDLLGAKTSYDEKAGKVYVEGDYSAVEMSLNSKKALVHRKYDFSGIPQEVELDAAPRLSNGTVYLPLRFVAESLDATVDWDARSSTAFISTGFDIIPVERLADYSIVNPYEEDNQELLDWYEKQKVNEGIFSLVINQDTYVLISAGEKPTGGYGMELESATEVRPGSLYLTARLTKPDPDAMVTMVITYPNVLIKLENQSFDVIDGEIME